MDIRRLLTYLLSLTITAVFLGLALYRVDFARLASALLSADYRLIGLAALCTLASYILRTARWQRLLAPTKQVPLMRLLPVLVVGFALNNLFPGRPGEFARAYWLGRREELSKTLGLATILLERVADGIALIAFLLLAFAAFVPLRLDLPPAAETIAVAASVLFGIALAGMLFLLLRESIALVIFQKITHLLPRSLATRLERMLGSFVVGLHSLKSGRNVLVIAVLSLAVWAVEAASYSLMLSAFKALPGVADRGDLGHAAAAVFTMVMINLGVMIPAAPGGVGPFEAAAIFALASFGVNETLAASVALSSHTIQYLLVTGLGLVFVWRAGISLVRAEDATTE